MHSVLHCYDKYFFDLEFPLPSVPDGMVESMGQNLSIKFYNGVLNLYAPAFIESQKEGVPGMYRDVTASIYPAIAYNEEVLWYESQAEGVLACENLCGSGK